MIIQGSEDLALFLNIPLSPSRGEDLTGVDQLMCDGNTYEVDRQMTTTTLTVLKNGTAARYSPEGAECPVAGHDGATVDASEGHWCPADVTSWTSPDYRRGVVRDWRIVTAWDVAPGKKDRTVHGSLEEAQVGFEIASERLTRLGSDYFAPDYEEAQVPAS